jgi:replicative DNA helicase
MQEHNSDLLEELGLENPDQDKAKSYDWPDDFLQRIIGSLVSDSNFLLQSVNLIKPEYFRSDAHKAICSIILNHYKSYNDRPDKVIIRKQLMDRVKDLPNVAYYLAELDAVCDAYEPGVEKREFFLDQITEFAKTQALRTAYTSTLDIFRSKRADKWDRIRDKLQEALLVDRDVDLGLDYLDTVETRYERMLKAKDDQEFYPTGFELIDSALNGGLSRGEIGGFAGMSSAGKSLALVKVGKTNLMLGRNVLYISLEMEEDKIAERFDSMLAQVPIWELYSGKKPEEVRGVLEEGVETWGRLFIKQFPAGTADVTTCRAFISQLQMHGFSPDLVIVDYVGEMRDIPGIKTYESRQRLVRDLRGMAVELDVCVFTAMQINRGGRDALKDKQYIDDDLLADSAGQVRPLDALWTISQTEIEQKANCGTLFASKHRSGRSRFMVKFCRNPKTLEMEQISEDTWKRECSKVQDKSMEEAAMEDYAKESNKFIPNKG